MYRGITSKKLLNNWFFVFFGFWQEKPVFLQESFWQGCQKYFGLVQWNTYRSTLPNGSLENSRTFGYFLKFSGQWRKNFFQVWQNSNSCPREQFMKFFFQKRIIRYFFRFWANVYFQRKIRQSCETRNLCIRGSFWGNTIFELYIIFHTFFGLWSKKRLVGKNIFSQVVTTAIRASRGIFSEKVLFLNKSFVCSSVLVFEQLFLSIDEKIVRVSKKQPTNTEKSWRKKFVEKLFFFNHFRFSSRKVWTIRQKILAGLSKLHSKCSEEPF